MDHTNDTLQRCRSRLRSFISNLDEVSDERVTDFMDDLLESCLDDSLFVEASFEPSYIRAMILLEYMDVQ